MTGRVVDAAGRPVKGARAQLGDVPSRPPSRSARRTIAATFTLENCEAGPTIVTVQAEGFAPQIHDVRVEGKTEPVVVTLSEPGGDPPRPGRRRRGQAGRRRLRRRRHLARAAVALAPGHHRRGWPIRVAQARPVTSCVYDAFKRGYMSSRQVPLTASDREQVITLHPELVITGRVTDAETGRPVPGFRLILGQKYPRRDETHWAENEAVEVAGGRYTTRFDEPARRDSSSGSRSPGYQPAESRAFRSTEGSQTFDIALRRGGGFSGVVLLPDGKPAAGAEVVLATETAGLPHAGGAIRPQVELPDGPDRPRWPIHAPPDGRQVPARRRWRRRLCRRVPGRIRDSRASWCCNRGGRSRAWSGSATRPGADQEIVYNRDISLRGGRHYGLDYGYRTTDR